MRKMFRTPEAQVEILSLDEVYKIMFLSFKFSQGSKNLQTRLLRYLAHRRPNMRLPPGTQISQDMISEVLENMSKSGKHLQFEQEDIQSELTDRFQDAWRYLHDHSHPIKKMDSFVLNFLNDLLMSDNNYLERARMSTKHRKSYFKDYVLDSKTTSVPEWDELFALCKQVVTTNQNLPEQTIILLRQVLNGYQIEMTGSKT